MKILANLAFIFKKEEEEEEACAVGTYAKALCIRECLSSKEGSQRFILKECIGRERERRG